jgi:carbamoyl-phosphate synthase large subunit
MNTIIVLVTGIGSCGTGEGLVKALKLVKGKYRIVGCDMQALSALSYRVDAGYQVPRATDTGYIPAINRIIRDEKVDVLLPGSDKEMEVISNAIDQIDKHVFVLAHPKETVNICRDKWETYLYLKKHGFDCPESYIPDDPQNLAFPLFIKDRFGGGSKHAFKIENEEELKVYLHFYAAKGMKPIIQRYVGSPEEEYTTGVLFGKDGRLISAITFKRTLIAGASGIMTCKEYPEVTQNAVAIARTLKTVGSINIQSRLVDGKPYAFEINPRFSGSSPARAGLGANELDMAIDEFYLGRKVESPKIQYNTAVLRCFQEVSVDLAEVEKLTQGRPVSHSGRIHDYV